MTKIQMVDSLARISYRVTAKYENPMLTTLAEWKEHYMTFSEADLEDELRSYGLI